MHPIVVINNEGLDLDGNGDAEWEHAEVGGLPHYRDEDDGYVVDDEAASDTDIELSDTEEYFDADFDTEKDEYESRFPASTYNIDPVELARRGWTMKSMQSERLMKKVQRYNLRIYDYTQHSTRTQTKHRPTRTHTHKHTQTYMHINTRRHVHTQVMSSH